MIGVIANSSDHDVVREFFELFKTPWEFYRDGQEYQVVLCAGDDMVPATDARLTLIYGGKELLFDAEEKISIASQTKNTRIFLLDSVRIPIYGNSATFQGNGLGPIIIDEESRQSAILTLQLDGRTTARIGYDLFTEIQILLTKGQPARNAEMPALELHIKLLRELILASGAMLVEVPPAPDGHQFIACLTHDVDHPLIRPHKFDHTMFGFLYRATLGSLSNLFRGRTSLANLLKNCAAAFQLPFVYLGWAKDFWSPFDDYIKWEKGFFSSFFIIPFAGLPGDTNQGPAPAQRAAGYGASDIAERIQVLSSAGCEIGLHGIDAWCNSSRGREELQEIRRIAQKQELGVRMHWLYFDEQSPITLEQAGADYDSTVGYNETIGYRAGTTQVYKPLAATRLLELPLHVMDTALFYPSYLNLTVNEANLRVNAIIDNAIQFGGVVTFNWHDRSIAPERLWGDTYTHIINQLKSKQAWVCTAAEAVSWFRNRRSISFQSDFLDMKIAAKQTANLPGFRVRIHNAPQGSRITASGPITADYVNSLESKTSAIPCPILQ